jgi:transcriptional regulator with XRE-family HTH domain
MTYGEIMDNLGATEVANNIQFIILAGRKLRGLTQSELAKMTNISQSLMSKLEKGQLRPSAILWYELCQVLNIDWDCQIFGYIDDLKNSWKSTFRHSKKYGAPYSSTVRSIHPMLSILRASYGDRKFFSFLQKEGFNVEYFYCLGNKVSFLFFTKVLQKTSELVEKKSNLKVDQYIMERSTHGKIFESIKFLPTIEEKLQAYCENSIYYEENFIYSYEKSKNKEYNLFLKHCDPIIELGIKFFDNSLVSNLNDYKRKYIKNYLDFNQSDKFQVTLKESGFKDGTNQSIYQVTQI